MTKSPGFRRNLLFNWTGHAATMAVMFFLSPYVVHNLGPFEYGLWSLITVLVGCMGVLDIGLSPSTTRQIVVHLAKNDHAAVNETIRTSLSFFASSGRALAAFVLGVGAQVPAVLPSVQLG